MNGPLVERISRVYHMHPRVNLGDVSYRDFDGGWQLNPP